MASAVIATDSKIIMGMGESPKGDAPGKGGLRQANPPSFKKSTSKN